MSCCYAVTLLTNLCNKSREHFNDIQTMTNVSQDCQGLLRHHNTL